MAHSIVARDIHQQDPDPRITVGQKRCKQPYRASVFNISAMSFGALSDNAVRALNRGAHAGVGLHVILHDGEVGRLPGVLPCEALEVFTGAFGSD